MANASIDRKTVRLEAFSDAVLAIAITLPLVDLKAPEVAPGGDLAAAYLAAWPHYLAYALSFLVIGLYWIHSHFGGKIVRKTDHGFNLLTLAFLAAVSVTPYPTLPVAEHLGEGANGRTAAFVYACVLTAPMLVWLARWVYAVRSGLLDPHLTPAYLKRLTVKYAATVVLALLGVALALVGDGMLGIATTILVTLSYMAPPGLPAYRPGEEPENELQEADERPA